MKKNALLYGITHKDTNMEIKINLKVWLRIVILILMVIFLVLFNILPKTDCDTCSFDVEGKNIGTEKFLDLYFGKCIQTYRFGDMPDVSNLSNLSFGD